MEQGYDEELEKLLGEIPRATSAPPHLEELQRSQDHRHTQNQELQQQQQQQPRHQHQQNQQQSFVATKDMSHDAASIMAHFPMLYKPFTEPHHVPSIPMNNTRSFDDADAGDPPVAPNHLSPGGGYNGLLSGTCSIRTKSSIDHDNVLPHGRNLSNPDLVSDVTLSILSSSASEIKGLADEDSYLDASREMGLSLQEESHIFASDQEKGMGKTKTIDSCHSSPISNPNNAMRVVSSVPESPSYDSRLPASLLADPFMHNTSELFENGLRADFEKLSLSRNGLAVDNRNVQPPPGFSVLQNGQIPLDIQGTGLFSEQNVGLMDSSLGGAAMQLGFQQSLSNRSYPFSLSPGVIPQDMKMVYAQQMHEAVAAAHAQQQLEERMQCRQRIKEEFLLRQQKLQEQQARFYASLYGQSGAAYNGSHSSTQNDFQASVGSCNVDLLQQQASSKTFMNGGFAPDVLWPASVMLSRETSQSSGLCRYFLHGFCTRGDLCPFSHSPAQGNNIPVNNGLVQSENTLGRTRKGSRLVQNTPTLLMPTLKTKTNGHPNGHILANGAHLPSPSQLSTVNGSAAWKGLSPETLQPVNSQQLLSPQQQSPPPPKYTTLKEVEGRIYGIAKDQHGCRFLQRKFEEGVFEDVQKIFVEIVDHVVELMTDPFGNYLVQKLLEVCDEAQRMEILYRVTGNDQLVTISLNMHGTRAVQKLIETLKSPEQVALVISSLRQGVVTLIKDLNGNHVVQRCLQRLSTEDSQFIFDAAADHCVEIATHRHGCCVLQRCVDYSTGQQRERLVAEIAANALVLSQDPFGNYVVQYILDLGLTWVINEVISRLEGNFVHLAMQKFSSNVVEKCLKLAGEESKACVIKELMNSTRLAQLLQDPFANYVVQSALTVSKGALHFGLVEAIRPHLPALRSSPYGKRILSRTSLKK